MLTNTLKFFALLLAVLGVSCSTASKSAQESHTKELGVWLTDDAYVSLLPVECIDDAVDELHRLTADWSGREFSINALVQADSEGLLLYGMGEMGQELLVLDYNGTSISFSGIMASNSTIKPEYILMDLQLAYYNDECVSNAVRKAGLSYSSELIGGIERRTISDRGNTVLTIASTAESLHISNELRGYSYTALKEPSDG